MTTMLQERASPAFQQLSDTNRGPLIIITTYIFFICSCLAVIVKVWTRLSTARNVVGTDYLMLGGLALALAQAIALTQSVNHGLGRHEEDLSLEDLKTASQAYYAANILTIATLAAAKASVIMLITSIQPLRPVLLGCYGLLGFVALWMISSIFALAFQCDLPAPWALGPQNCVDQYALNAAIGAINILTDLLVVVLAYLMMRTTQVSTSKRWAVVALFGLRVATPPFVICALVYYSNFSASTHDRTWHATAPTIWTQIMIHISIITACIPSLKRFLADVQSGLMGATISEQYEMTHSGGKATQLQSASGTGGFGSRMASRVMMSRRSQGASGVRSQVEKSQVESIQGSGEDETFGNSAFAKHGRANSRPEESESVKGLARNAIHQKIDYEVEYEERGHERDWSDDDGRAERLSS